MDTVWIYSQIIPVLVHHLPLLTRLGDLRCLVVLVDNYGFARKCCGGADLDPIAAYGSRPHLPRRMSGQIHALITSYANCHPEIAVYCSLLRVRANLLLSKEDSQSHLFTASAISDQLSGATSLDDISQISGAMVPGGYIIANGIR